MSVSSVRFRVSIATLALCSACVFEEAEPDDATTGDVEPGDSSSSTGVTPSDSSSDSSSDGDSSSEGGPVPTDCPAPTAGPTMHPGENVTEPELWTADGSPHLLPYDFTIQSTVTIEPCARVQLGGHVMVTLGTDGWLMAAGEADRPIVFERLDDEPWTSLRVLGGFGIIAHTVFDGGGYVGNTLPDLTGAIWVLGDANHGDSPIYLDHVEIRNSQAAGLRLQGFDWLGGDAVTITGGESHPVSVAANLVHAVPPGTYVGNADDQIVVTTENSASITISSTIHNRGVPYHIGLPGQVGDLRVQAMPGELATLTIEPGVELRFQQDGVLTIDHATGEEPATGALVAVGTADAPIRMTSAEPAPAAGDWLGVYFGGRLAATSRMDHVEVEYAGGASSSGSNSCPYPGPVTINSAAIRVFGVPPDAFITNTAIVASAGHGIDRGWRDNVVVDMLATNDIDAVGCLQTWSRLDDGSCPDPVPCP